MLLQGANYGFIHLGITPVWLQQILPTTTIVDDRTCEQNDHTKMEWALVKKAAKNVKTCNYVTINEFIHTIKLI